MIFKTIFTARIYDIINPYWDCHLKDRLGCYKTDLNIPGGVVAQLDNKITKNKFKFQNILEPYFYTNTMIKYKVKMENFDFKLMKFPEYKLTITWSINKEYELDDNLLIANLINSYLYKDNEYCNYPITSLNISYFMKSLYNYKIIPNDTELSYERYYHSSVFPYYFPESTDVTKILNTMHLVKDTNNEICVAPFLHNFRVFNNPRYYLQLKLDTIQFV
jgi:hypothetical protein